MAFTRSLLALVPFAFLACAPSPTVSGGRPVYPPSQVEGPTAKCEAVCNLEVVAPTAESFCDALLLGTKDDLPGAKCSHDAPLGLPTRDEAAVRDAMLVDVVAKEVRVALLALRTERGWELAAELGAVHGASIEAQNAVEVVGARPVEAPGLAPYGVEIKVRVQDAGERTEKVFVCGRTGAKTACPRAVITG